LRIGREERGADVLLSLGVVPPTPSPVPVVQLLCDVIPLVCPDPLFDPARRMWAKAKDRWSTVDSVVAISTWTARTGIEHLDLRPERVHVVPLAASPVFVADGPAEASDRPYLLVASAWDPHKGFDAAVAVLDRLLADGRDVELRIAGEQAPFSLRQIESLRAASTDPSRVRVLGWVPDLAAAYRGAACVLVPRRAEGFGLPALEAMACGAPVVAFANSALVDVVTGGGELVPDGDVDAMAAAVRRVLDDAGHREALRHRGVDRAAAYSWEATAEAFATVLRAVGDTKVPLAGG
jgi:glycosyltransferase involved in cell wall biosynthesis